MLKRTKDYRFLRSQVGETLVLLHPDCNITTSRRLYETIGNNLIWRDVRREKQSSKMGQHFMVAEDGFSITHFSSSSKGYVDASPGPRRG